MRFQGSLPNRISEKFILSSKEAPPRSTTGTSREAAQYFTRTLFSSESFSTCKESISGQFCEHPRRQPKLSEKCFLGSSLKFPSWRKAPQNSSGTHRTFRRVPRTSRKVLLFLPRKFPFFHGDSPRFEEVTQISREVA